MTKLVGMDGAEEKTPCLCEPAIYTMTGEFVSGEYRCEYCREIEDQIWREMIGRWGEHGGQE